jgi:hypothetical protein
MGRSEERRGATLDALALVKARLDGDEEAAAYLLDEAADLRAVTVELARLLAAMAFMMSEGEPERVLSRFRAAYGAG